MQHVSVSLTSNKEKRTFSIFFTLYTAYFSFYISLLFHAIHYGRLIFYTDQDEEYYEDDDDDVEILRH